MIWKVNNILKLRNKNLQYMSTKITHLQMKKNTKIKKQKRRRKEKSISVTDLIDNVRFTWQHVLLS